ncbi:MAG TPA: hypothetical protein VII92_15290 [Anaerolineae bacterium]
MKKNSYLWLAAIAALLIASMACSALAGGNDTDTAGGGQGDAGGATGGDTGGGAGGGVTNPTQAPPKNTGYNTDFPLPSNVTNFTDLGDSAINFQTDMNLTDSIAFYRDAFTSQGYTERTINTAITDTTFSMVFDGHASGKAIVIQGVDLGGSTNVNIRFEAI